ncbi:MAG: hypothetical protein R3181_00205 [Rubricoccaceae bacterium]|nr:hypothetical protein [Rubricoccaceae bacterium]
MPHLLVWNQVRDFARWLAVFEADAEAHREAGLELERVWRTRDDPNQVFFVFFVGDLERANAFMDDPVAKEHAEAAGVVRGFAHFLDAVPLAPET